jgi:hypothetical protein
MTSTMVDVACMISARFVHLHENLRVPPRATRRRC